MKLCNFSLFSFSLFSLYFTGSCIFYEGYKVLKIHVSRIEDAQSLIAHLNKQFKFDIFKNPTRRDSSVYIAASQNEVSNIQLYLSRIHLKTDIIHHDLQSFIKNWMERNERLRNTSAWFDSYHEFDEIMDWVDGKAETCGNKCEILQLNSNSYEGRILKVIKIGTPGQNKEKLWIDATIHSREWIAPAVAQYFIERLIDDYNIDDEVREIVDTYDFYIQPIVNPDGYVYTWTDERLWRKSRLINESNPDCIGTDVNRNFDFQWNTVGVGEDPCDITWPGYSAFSDPEAKALADFVVAQGNWTMFITMHSYGQLWLLPYGYTSEKILDYDKLFEAGEVTVEALKDVYGTEYELGSSSEILYESSGTSRDWAYGVAKAEYVYTVELRDTGDFGFELPPEQIKPCVIETWAGLKALITHIMNE